MYHVKSLGLYQIKCLHCANNTKGFFLFNLSNRQKSSRNGEYLTRDQREQPKTKKENIENGK